jgi:hypothetical protein
MSSTKTMILIKTDGTVSEIPNTGYESIKTAIGGGYLEAVPMGNDHSAYIDEEGKLKNLPINPVATFLWYKRLRPMNDFLCGDCVIVRSTNDDGELDGEDYSPRPEIRTTAEQIGAMDDLARCHFVTS